MTQALGKREELRKRSGTRTVPASPEFVLEGVRAIYRHQCSVDLDAEVDVELSFQPPLLVARRVPLVETCKLADAVKRSRAALRPYRRQSTVGSLRLPTFPQWESFPIVRVSLANDA